MPLPSVEQFIGTDVTEQGFKDAQKQLVEYVGNEVPKKIDTDAAFATKADKATTLAGYGIADTYTKSQVDASLTAYVGGRKAYTTLALAQADQANLTANTAIEVTNDPTSANNGTYQWNGTTLTKSAYDALTQAKEYTDDTLVQLNKGLEDLTILDQTDKFIEATKGPFVVDFNTPANASLTTANGEAVVTSNISTGSIVSIDTLRHVLDNVQRRLILKFKVEDVSDVTGAAIFTGENTGILYSSNGVISVVNTAWNIQDNQYISDALLAFTANEEVTLDVTLNGDGSGVATATNAAGYNRSLSFTGMQKGAVHLAIRRSFATKSTTFKSLSVVSNPVTAKNISDATKGVTPKGFDNTLAGFYNITTDSVYRIYKLSIFGSVLNIDTNGANNAVYYAKNGTAFNEASEFELEFKKKTGTITAGGCIIIGDGVNRKIFAYLSNGAVGLLNAVGNIEEGSVVADMAFDNEQNAKIKLTVSNGDAVLTAIHPTGKTHSLSYTGVSYGNVYVGWRGGYVTADLNYLSKRPIPSSYLTLEKKLNVSSPNSKIPKTWKVLPDSEPDRSVKGFTCTGLAKITAGQFRGCWAIGDDGRLSEDISSPYEPQIHILDGDFNRILLTIAGGYTNDSMQGVTFDTITNAHLWAACAGNNTLRKYSLEIGSEGVEVVADRISMADLGLSITPNALAFDETRGTGKGALWLGASTGGTIYLIDCDPMAATRVITTITVANTVDHIQLIDGSLLYQGASNGRKTTVYKYDIATNVESTVWVDLEYWTAPEGLYYDKTWNTLYAINDGGFHNSEKSSPRFNCVLEYSLDF